MKLALAQDRLLQLRTGAQDINRHISRPFGSSPHRHHHLHTTRILDSGSANLHDVRTTFDLHPFAVVI